MRKKVIFIGALVLGIPLVLTVLWKGKGFLFDERIAESELHDYLAKMYRDKEVLGEDCVGRDTDGDGYVSCTARVKGKDGPEETLALECASELLNSGCKPRIGILPTSATK
jgi:predicted sulfurtransferase